MASQEQGSLGLDPESDARKKPSNSSFEGLYAAGLELFSERKFNEAAGNFEKALQLNRNHTGSIKYLGMALFYLGHYTRAIEQFQLFLRKEPENEDVYWYCGMAYLQLSRYVDAERCQRKVVSINSKSVKGYFSLGQILYRRGLYSESISVLKRADELEANNPEALFLLGEAYNKIDEIDMAVSCFETVLKYQQDNPKVFYNLGILYDKKGMPEKASLMYRQAKELSSPQFISSQKIPLLESKEEGTFFSRSLTVVNPHSKQSDGKTVNKERYEKFRVKQLKKKPYRVQNFQESLSENVGTMDLTKASLKINEAIKIIKEKRK